MVTVILYAKQKKRQRCTEQTLDSVGEGEGGMFLENSMYNMGREVGGGIRMGNRRKSMADSCQCMTKTTTIL